MSEATSPEVGVITGSRNDWKIMKEAVFILAHFKVPFEKGVKSVHRTPDEAEEYARGAEDRGLKMIIAGAGGSAALPGMTATWSELPVIGVPIAKNELDDTAEKSMKKMPEGRPLALVGNNQAKQAGILAVKFLAVYNPDYRQALREYRDNMRGRVERDDQEIHDLPFEDF